MSLESKSRPPQPVTSGWRRLHHEEIHNSYASPFIIRVIKSRRISWTGHVERIGKVKVKLSLCFDWAPRHEGVLGSGGIAPRILDLGNRRMWVVSFTRQPPYPQGKSPWYQLDRRLDGPFNFKLCARMFAHRPSLGNGYKGDSIRQNIWV
jgi:hypothetical protein